jgi:hypothetical protein
LVKIENDKTIPGWVTAEAGVQMGRLEHKDKSMIFCFSSKNAHLSQVGDSITSPESYMTHAGVLFPFIHDAIRPSKYLRHGIRFYDIMGVASISEALNMICKYSALKMDPAILEIMGKPKHVGQGISLRVEDERSGLRLAVSTVRRVNEEKVKEFSDDYDADETAPPKTTPAYKQHKDQKQRRLEEMRHMRDMRENPQLAVLVDLDYHEKESDKSDPVGFIKRGFAERARILPRLFSRE